MLVDMTFGAVYSQMKETASLDAYKRMAYEDSMVGIGNRAAIMKGIV